MEEYLNSEENKYVFFDAALVSDDKENINEDSLKPHHIWKIEKGTCTHKQERNPILKPPSCYGNLPIPILGD